MEDNVLFSRPQVNPPTSPEVSQNTPNVAPAPSQPPVSAPPPPPLPSHKQKRGFGLVLKILLGVLVVVVLAVGIFFFLSSRTPKTEDVQITFWGLWEDPKAMQVVINDFEKKNPHIKVTYVKQDIKQYRERLTSRIPSGNGPDVFYFHNTWTNMLGQFLTPLPSDTLSLQTFRDSYYPVMEYDLVRGGAIYGVPLGTDALSLFVNTDLLQAGGVEVPENWDDFDKAAKKLTVKDEAGKIQTSGAALGAMDNVTHSSDLVSLLFVQNGVNLPTITANPTPVTEALEFYTQYAKDEGTWDPTLDPSLLAFANGKLAFYFGYSWDVFNIKQLNSSLPFSIHPVPSLPNRTMTITSYWAAGTSVESKHQKESALFLSHLSKKETMQMLYKESAKTRGFGMPYPHKELAKTLENDALVGPFVSQAPFTYSTYFASDTYDNGVNTKMNVYLGNAVQAILSGASIESSVEVFLQGVAQVQSEYGI